MSSGRERVVFVGAAVGLWLLFVVQAALSPVLLDDWFQLRYWRDHELSLGALWELGRHNYLHYNPRMGDVFLALIDASQIIHIVVTPLVQIAALVATFVIAFGRWPRRSLHDLQLLLFIQVMIWLVVPIPGIIYFYRPIATNYLWAFTFTLALFVPYRLALANDGGAPRPWLVPAMLVLGWIAGMCNEHTGPTAMLAMAVALYLAWRRHRLRAWMVSGMIGLYVGFPMLIFAPGQSKRYAGLATHATPSKLLDERGLTGCLEILFDFIAESRLGILLFVAAVVRYVIVFRMRGERIAPLPRTTLVTAGVLAAAAVAIVVTLFASPITTDRVFFASGVLLVAAFAVCTEQLFAARSVRHLVVGASIVLFAYHAVRFVETYVAVKAENDARIALMRETRPGTVAYVPAFDHNLRTRWHLGDDFQIHPWLGEYVATELYDLANLHVNHTPARSFVRYRVARNYDPPLAPRALPPVEHVSTYREWLRDPASRLQVVPHHVTGHRLTRFAITVIGLPFADPKRRPIVMMEWTPSGYTFVDGSPYDESRGHFIRVRATSMPKRLESTYVIGCGHVQPVKILFDDHAGPLLPVNERDCRGAFTALMCEPDRCWIAGWY